MHEYLQPIVHFLHLHPHWAGFISFVVVFCEAMAVIGVIVPGTITMTAIGMAVGSHVIPATSTFAWAICGAILGDYLSYLIGVHFQGRLHRMWPLSKYPHWLEAGEKFFDKHGGKSIIIGRFVGPMRAMIPMVAGMLKMPTGRFLVAAIPSASIWAILYIVPGVLLGALSLELPPKLAAEFLLFFMGIAVAIWFITWLITTFLAQICYGVDFIIMKIWRFFERFKTTRQALIKLADPRKPNDHGQLTILVSALVSFIIFMLLMAAALHHGKLTNFNQPLYHLLRSFRTQTFDIIMLTFTFLGQAKTLLIASIGIMLFLIWKRYWYVLAHFVVVLALAVSGTIFFKHFVNSPRPGGLLNGPTSPSFPSGHTVLSVSIFGFLAMILSRAFKKRKFLPYLVAIILAVLIGFSRLYLGAHWLTDVLGGMFMALTIVLVVTVFYRCNAQNNLRPGKTLAAILFFIFASWTGYSALHYKKDLFNYQLIWPTKTITLKNWEKQTRNNISMPVYRVNRFGHPIDALNLEWLGNLDNIEQNLVAKGWQSYSSNFNIQGIVQRLTNHPIRSRLPIFSQLYNNHPEAILLVLPKKDGTPNLLLRLWQSDIEITHSKYPLWIGTIAYYQKPHLISFHEKRKFIGAISDFKKFLHDFNWEIITYQKSMEPAQMKDLNWNGKMLLVKPTIQKAKIKKALLPSLTKTLAHKMSL